MTQQRRGFEPTINSFCLVGALDHSAKLTCLFRLLEFGLYECSSCSLYYCVRGEGVLLTGELSYLIFQSGRLYL